MFGLKRPAPTPSLAEVIQMAQRGEVTLLDVRERDEIAASGTAKGALTVPLGVLPLKADPKAPDAVDFGTKPIAVFCAAGARAGRAVSVLEGFGLTAWNIGGFGQWAAAGGPTVRG